MNCLLEQKNVKELQKNSWEQKAFESFYKILNDPDFPCIFAIKAFSNESILFCFRTLNDDSFLVKSVEEYVNFVKNLEIKKRIFYPLIVFFEEQFTSLEEEQLFAWQQIQILHNNDKKEWPQNIPTNANDPQWTFCFNQMQLFFNVSCPHHKILKNRNLGSHLAFVINPRENFDFVANYKDKKGVGIRTLIQQRLKKFNKGFLPKELGFFGKKENLEYKQYTLSELGQSFIAKCPFRFRKNNVKL